MHNSQICARLEKKCFSKSCLNHIRLLLFLLCGGQNYMLAEEQARFPHRSPPSLPTLRPLSHVSTH